MSYKTHPQTSKKLSKKTEEERWSKRVRERERDVTLISADLEECGSRSAMIVWIYHTASSHFYSFTLNSCKSTLSLMGESVSDAAHKKTDSPTNINDNKMIINDLKT